MLSEVGHCKGIENYSRHLAGSAPGDPPATPTDRTTYVVRVSGDPVRVIA